jgi:hypothetical protein
MKSILPAVPVVIRGPVHCLLMEERFLSVSEQNFN